MDSDFFEISYYYNHLRSQRESSNDDLSWLTDSVELNLDPQEQVCDTPAIASCNEAFPPSISLLIQSNERPNMENKEVEEVKLIPENAEEVIVTYNSMSQV